MGKRASMFRCNDCGHDFWKWFEHLDRDELIDFATKLECPECGSQDWKLTDASSFAGSKVYGDAAIPRWLASDPSITTVKNTLGISELRDRIVELEREIYGEVNPGDIGR